jgi:enamine deaminase RidA (YjgF/YER057c/UK114 family)
MRPRLLLLLLLAAGCAGGTPGPVAPVREHIAPEGWESSYHELHYSPVVKIGDRVIVSGIPAAVGATDEEKIRWMFRKLEEHLAAAGATMADVVELTSFHVSTDSADFKARLAPMLVVHREVFRDHYPAWTAVGTSGLYSANAPVELRAVAIIGSGKAPRVRVAPAAGVK